jgi:hypothetical protein
MHMITWFEAAVARRAEAGFDEGFHGAMFAEFDKLGEYGVKKNLSDGVYPEIKHTAAIEWIRRKAKAIAATANVRANVALGTAIASALISLAALAVALLK